MPIKDRILRNRIQKSSAEIEDLTDFPLQILELVPGRPLSIRKTKRGRPRTINKDKDSSSNCPDEFYSTAGEQKGGKEFLIRLVSPLDLILNEELEKETKFYDLQIRRFRDIQRLDTRIAVKQRKNIQRLDMRIAVKPRKHLNNNSPKPLIVNTSEKFSRGRRSESQRSSSQRSASQRSAKSGIFSTVTSELVTLTNIRPGKLYNVQNSDS